MNVLATEFAEAKVVVPAVFHDERGFFKEVYARDRYAAAGIEDQWLQDNLSSSRKNVLRGLHFDFRMAKLVQCVRGEIFDVIVDVRAGSATYGRWQGFRLSADNHHQLYVPRGFAHGFLALCDDVLVHYKQSAQYDPGCERALAWNDPTVGVVWPVSGEPLLSVKDAAAPRLS